MSFFSRLIPRIEKHSISHTGWWGVTIPVDFSVFMGQLVSLFPESAVISIEGTTIDKKLSEGLRARLVPSPKGFEKTTRWPKSEVFHVALTPQNISFILSVIEENELVPSETLNHFHIFLNDQSVLEWFDFPSDRIMISDEIKENDIKRFCGEIGSRYEKEH